jgi:hypothetical protein
VKVSDGSGDLDGDGRPDAVSVYADGTEAVPGPWHLTVTLGGQKGRVTAVISTLSPSETSVSYAGAASVGGGPTQAAFVNVGFGASDSLVGLFSLTGCELARVSIAPSTEPAIIPIGGSVTHLDGAQCRDTKLVLLTATSSDGATYQAKAQTYRLQGSSLVPDGDPQLTTLGGSNPDLAPYGSLDCPGVALA